MEVFSFADSDSRYQRRMVAAASLSEAPASPLLGKKALSDIPHWAKGTELSASIASKLFVVALKVAVQCATVPQLPASIVSELFVGDSQFGQVVFSASGEFQFLRIANFRTASIKGYRIWISAVCHRSHPQ
jgi:hypothetical protein